MNNWTTIASDQRIQATVAALAKNGIEAVVVPDQQSAKETVLSMIPEGSEVMVMTSVTLDTIGVTESINNSNGKYRPVKDILASMDRKTQGLEMNRLGAAPEYALGSVHAVTEAGEVLIASGTGSQLPAYAYGASHVIWVVGAQKLVTTMEQAMKRIYEHTLPLESERARKAYGVAGSAVNKLLIINKEGNPDRIKMVIVKEAIGY